MTSVIKNHDFFFLNFGLLTRGFCVLETKPYNNTAELVISQKDANKPERGQQNQRTLRHVDHR